ncbi:hypothetical protein LEP1GSC059_2733 [Leptospira noguchii serovar Panama str. CZ214]|uniref:Uncharacterized protein n=1 Tax=Leptospira noguchii serovar Panama str. CZ214 TaxID=1001595 RepID=T0GRT1_9LEPT|nr:hypothetical protein LEP1GSC059_2733 [Leptospira noguchii serovar Panama str. CZ214]
MQIFYRIDSFWICSVWVLFMILNVSCSTMHDSISVENSVSFFKYELNSNKTSIKFKIKVSNQSKNPIPDLGVMNRSKFVNFYFNGKVDNPMKLYNGLEAINHEQTIPPIHHGNFNGMITWKL